MSNNFIKAFCLLVIALYVNGIITHGQELTILEAIDED